MTNYGDIGDKCDVQICEESGQRLIAVEASALRRPLAVSFKTAGEMIDRSSRTIKRMVERGDLVELPGYALVTYDSLETWVRRMCRSESQPIAASPRGDAPKPLTADTLSPSRCR